MDCIHRKANVLNVQDQRERLIVITFSCFTHGVLFNWKSFCLKVVKWFFFLTIELLEICDYIAREPNESEDLKNVTNNTCALLIWMLNIGVRSKQQEKTLHSPPNLWRVASGGVIAAGMLRIIRVMTMLIRTVGPASNNPAHYSNHTCH